MSYTLNLYMLYVNYISKKLKKNKTMYIHTLLLKRIIIGKDQEQFTEEIQLAHKYEKCLIRNIT